MKTKMKNEKRKKNEKHKLGGWANKVPLRTLANFFQRSVGDRVAESGLRN